MEPDEHTYGTHEGDDKDAAGEIADCSTGQQTGLVGIGAM